MDDPTARWLIQWQGRFQEAAHVARDGGPDGETIGADGGKGVRGSDENAPGAVFRQALREQRANAAAIGEDQPGRRSVGRA